MRFVFAALAALFSGLHLYAALSRKEKRDAVFSAMVLGSVMMLAGAVFCLLRNSVDWVLALCGGVLVCACAVRNGVDSGKIHLQHHLVRGAIVLAVTAGFIYL